MSRQKQPAPPPPNGGKTWLVVGALGVAACLGFVLLPSAERRASDPQQTPSSASSAPAPVSTGADAAARSPVAEVPKVPTEGPLPPLPLSDFPAPRPPHVIRAVYEFAARHPEVLRYVPCYCGCERNGHVGNDDCFIASRDAQGNVTWDAHGMT